MRTIRDATGSLQAHPDKVLDIASDFYERLFTADELPREVLLARDEI